MVVDLLNRDISYGVFSMPMSRGTVLTMEVQRLMGFINIKTDLELTLLNNEHTQHVAGKHPL